MIPYLLFILLSMTAVSVLNGFFGGMGFGYAILWTVIATVSVIVIDGVTAAIAHAVKNYNPFHKIFEMKKREKRFYEKLGVKKWKDKIPELGKFLAKFAKDKIAEPNNNEYIFKFLIETCAGGVGHFVSLFTGFLIILILPYKLNIALPVALVSFIMNIPSIIVLRYNRARLVAVYRFNERKQPKKDAA